MSGLLQFHPELEEMFKLKGLVHVYAYDVRNNVIGCNETQLQLIEDTAGVSAKKIVGCSVEELFKNLGNSSEIVVQENEIVVKEKAPKQFYNVWAFSKFCRLELLTVKTPIYGRNGHIEGVFGISQYINKFSIKEALELGLSKRQIECLLLFLGGRSNKEIAHLMDISTRTVEDYFDSLRYRFNCYHRSELLVKVLQSNLLVGTNNMNIDLINEKTLLPTCSHKLISKNI